MPNAKVLEQKIAAVEALSDKMGKAASGVLVKYQGITVEDDTKMRKALREAGVSYKVVKNSLTGRACEEVGFGEMKQYLNGMTAIAISEKDAVSPAKILKEYAEKIESFQILAGYVDGAVIDCKTVEELASIPSKEVLIAKFMGSIKSPIYKFAYALKAIADKDAEGGEEAPAAE